MTTVWSDRVVDGRMAGDRACPPDGNRTAGSMDDLPVSTGQSRVSTSAVQLARVVWNEFVCCLKL